MALKSEYFIEVENIPNKNPALIFQNGMNIDYLMIN